MATAKETKSKSAAALAAAGDVPKGATRFLRVSTAGKLESFHRAGVKHTAAPVDHPLDRFDADQTEALFQEPKLSVAYVDVKPEKDAAK